MNILVVGGAGFIGSHCVDQYRADGHRVVVLDNLSSGRAEHLPEDVRLVVGDVRDRELVDSVFAEESFDLVNHHAAQLDVRVSVADPVYDAEQNILGSLVLLDAAAKHGVGRFVFASSGGTVYGDQQVFPADESHPTDPISPYGVSKLSVEKYLGYFHHQHGLRSVILRYTNIYGPRQNAHGEAGVVAIFCRRMLAGEGPVIYGSGEQTRDYVFVDDVARANVAALHYLDENERGIFNVATAKETTVNDLFRHLNGMAGNRFEEKHASAKPGEQFRSVCTAAKAEREMGWLPKIGVEEGLQKTWAYFRDQESN